MGISYYSENVKTPTFRRRVVSAWIHQVADKYDKEVGEITYLFCDDRKILEMNRRYLRHDYYTDIITFDQNVGDILFADIVISLDTVQSNADEYNQSFEEELLRVMIHGILHLCGLDDHTDEEVSEMRLAELEALRMLPEDLSDVWRKQP